MKKKIMSLMLAVAMVMSLGAGFGAGAVTTASEEEVIPTQADSLSAEMFDIGAIMSRPVTDYSEPTYLEGMHTPSDMFFNRENGVMSVASTSDPGAYFYAYAPMGTTYLYSFVNAKLPTSINTLNGRRAAFISLGIAGSMGGIDIGLRNVGSGWVPYTYDVYAGNKGTYYEQTHSFQLFEDSHMPDTVTNVIMMATPLNTTTMRVYMRGYDSTGGTGDTEFYRDITVKSGNFVTVGNRVQCQHYRFVSMVPNIGITTTLTDGTYMKNGALTNCQLYYDDVNHTLWSWDSDKVARRLISHEEKMSLTHSGCHDYFSIIYN